MMYLFKDPSVKGIESLEAGLTIVCDELLKVWDAPSALWLDYLHSRRNRARLDVQVDSCITTDQL